VEVIEQRLGIECIAVDKNGIALSPVWNCWYNNVKVEIEESALTPIKAERWKPQHGETYFSVGGSGNTNWHRWTNDSVDEKHWYAFNCFSTEAEALAEAEATLADRKARLDK